MKLPHNEVARCEVYVAITLSVFIKPLTIVDISDLFVNGLKTVECSVIITSSYAV